MSEVKVPSGYVVQQVLSAWQSARARLMDADPDLDEAALDEILGPKTGDVEEILARVLRASLEAKDLAEAAGRRRKFITERERRFDAREESLRGLAFALMDTLGKRKFELGDVMARVQQGRDKVEITNVDDVPDAYCEIVVTRKPERTMILADIKAGRPVPGAKLSNGMPYIVIKGT